MSDSEKNQRPNAHYPLSNKDHYGQESVTYFYNRERRLAMASKTVQDIYKEQPPRRFGLLWPLIGSRPRAILFSSIMVCCLLILIISFMGLDGNTHLLGGNRLAIQAMEYEGTVIVSLQKTVRKNLFFPSVSAYTGTVTIGVAADADTVFHHAITFTPERKERYGFAVPFAADELALTFEAGTHILDITIKTE
ncbi:MAG: hypothetical protein FWD36_03455 [Treponema sp.]|nr:hypothetical protein [Treponema sp.]